MNFFDTITADVKKTNEFVATYADVDRYIDTGWLDHGSTPSVG